MLSEINIFRTISQPISKRFQLYSISTDRKYTRSVASDNSKNNSAEDTKLSVYRTINYITILQTKNCFIWQSSADPISNNIALCEYFLCQPIENLYNILFDNKYIIDFYNILQNQSKIYLLVDLYSLIILSVENQFIQRNQSLKDIIDRYNDP